MHFPEERRAVFLRILCDEEKREEKSGNRTRGAPAEILSFRKLRHGCRHAKNGERFAPGLRGFGKASGNAFCPLFYFFVCRSSAVRGAGRLLRAQGCFFLRMQRCAGTWSAGFDAPVYAFTVILFLFPGVCRVRFSLRRASRRRGTFPWCLVRTFRCRGCFARGLTQVIR